MASPISLERAYRLYPDPYKDEGGRPEDSRKYRAQLARQAYSGDHSCLMARTGGIFQHDGLPVIPVPGGTS